MHACVHSCACFMTALHVSKRPSATTAVRACRHWNVWVLGSQAKLMGLRCGHHQILRTAAAATTVAGAPLCLRPSYLSCLSAPKPAHSLVARQRRCAAACAEARCRRGKARPRCGRPGSGTRRYVMLHLQPVYMHGYWCMPIKWMDFTLMT